MKKQKRLLVALVLCVVFIVMIFVPTEAVAQDKLYADCGYMLISSRDIRTQPPVDQEIAIGVN